MVTVMNGGVWLFDGREVLEDSESPELAGRLAGRLGRGRDSALAQAREGTITHGILAAHDRGTEAGRLSLAFDSLASHDITFVNIIQTARACGLEEFTLPYVLTNCHNSLCAVGGTINEDDHVFGLSAAEKYGGIYVPPHLAVIHSYVRETMAGGGRMILGSDSHTRYGALGTMGVGEGGGELVKQLLGQTYDMAYPRVIGVELSGAPRPGVGPQDVALALVGAVFNDGLVKNAALEFFGPGIAALSPEFRCGIDVMTTETTCWSSIWETDESIRRYLAVHGREEDYRALHPAALAYYDGLVRIDLSAVKPMIALPFHPSNVFEIDAFLSDPGDLLRQVEREAEDILGREALNGKAGVSLCDKVDTGGSGGPGKYRVRVDQGIIAGCAGGTFENIMAASAILAPAGRAGAGGAFSLSVYPGSQPVMLELARNGCMSRLIAAGAVIRSAFCGPCFGAGDVPANNGLSIRHTTRNFPNREGSRPADGQIASVALMDARSIAATAANGGYLASAERLPPAVLGETDGPVYRYDDSPYRARVYSGFKAPRPETPLRYGPNIGDWPPMEDLGEHLLLRIAAFITDPVTTTDEIIPSGETSSYRSNPERLAAFTLSRRDPGYVERARKAQEAERARKRAVEGGGALEGVPDWPALVTALKALPGLDSLDLRDLRIGSALYAVRPGDGSAREQAASSQKVLGGWANFALDYATKRYRSNLINWGIVPFTLDGEPVFRLGDFVFIPRIRSALTEGRAGVQACVLRPPAAEAGNAPPEVISFSLTTPSLTGPERAALLSGSLINLNRRGGV
ncbi:MAG: hydratase [Spirochaetaceae bacterium]|nr:hydratase [Spirochaetaceae bacterium]